MQSSYFPLLVLMLMTSGFVLILILLSIFIGPKNKTKIKQDPFECGTLSTGNPQARISVKYYMLAITFVVFDVEVVFLYPWAVKVLEYGWGGFLVAVPFVLLLVLGLVYEWRKGILDLK